MKNIKMLGDLEVTNSQYVAFHVALAPLIAGEAAVNGVRKLKTSGAKLTQKLRKNSK